MNIQMKSGLKSCVIFFIFICNMSTIVAQNANQLIGTWSTKLFDGGTQINVSWSLMSDGQCVYNFTANGQSNKIRSTWIYDDGVIYEKNEYGQLSSGRVKLIGSDMMSITVIDNGNRSDAGTVRIYTRAKKTISFKGLNAGKYCEGDSHKCTCPGFKQSYKNFSTCENCGHPKNYHNK